jgi:hypothetical protein
MAGRSPGSAAVGFHECQAARRPVGWLLGFLPAVAVWLARDVPPAGLVWTGRRDLIAPLCVNSPRRGGVDQSSGAAFELSVPLVLAVTAALVGAPLVAREVEQRTQLVAWTQSVTRQRWYHSKVVTIGGGLSLAGLLAGTGTYLLQGPATAVSPPPAGPGSSPRPGPSRQHRPGVRPRRRRRGLAATAPAAVALALVGFLGLFAAAGRTVQPSPRSTTPYRATAASPATPGPGPPAPPTPSPTTRPTSSGRCSSPSSPSCSPSPWPCSRWSGTPPAPAPSERPRRAAPSTAAWSASTAIQSAEALTYRGTLLSTVPGCQRPRLGRGRWLAGQHLASRRPPTLNAS